MRAVFSLKKKKLNYCNQPNRSLGVALYLYNVHRIVLKRKYVICRESKSFQF
jgi:hypothetical protein